MRSLILLAVILTSACYAEMTAGYYKAKGGIDDDAYQATIAFGVYAEYSKFVRLGAGSEGGLIFGASNPDGHVRPRTLGGTIRGDVSLVTGAYNRVRATGGVNLPITGDVRIKDADGMKTYGTTKTSGWFAGLSAEQTHIPTKVTRQLTIGYHRINATSDLFEDTTLNGAQARLTFTYWPVFRSVSPGFFGGLMNMMANNTVAGEVEYEAQDTSRSCAPIKSCSMAFNGEVCNYYEGSC